MAEIGAARANLINDMKPHLNNSSVGRPPSERKSSDLFASVTTLGVMALLVYIPYAEALNSLLDIKLFGYSALVTVIPTTVALACVGLLALKRPDSVMMVLAASAAAVSITLLRINWGIYGDDASFLHGMTDVRFVVLLPTYITLGMVASQTPWFRLWAPRVIVFNGGVQASAGILNTLGLLNFKVLGVDANVRDIVESGYATRATGLFAGSNMYAGFLVLAILMCVMTRWSPLIRVPACALLVGGILAAQSRYALAAAIIGVVWCTWRESIPAWARSVRFIALTAAVFALPFLLRDSSENVTNRFNNDLVDLDYQVRLDKALLGLRATFEDADTALLGAHPADLDLGDPIESFSDNSYVAILSSVGLPLTLLFMLMLFVCFRQARRTRMRPRPVAAFWFVVLTAALLNNAIYWDSWLYYMAVMYGVLGHADEAVRLPLASDTQHVPFPGYRMLLQPRGNPR